MSAGVGACEGAFPDDRVGEVLQRENRNFAPEADYPKHRKEKWWNKPGLGVP